MNYGTAIERRVAMGYNCIYVRGSKRHNQEARADIREIIVMDRRKNWRIHREGSTCLWQGQARTFDKVVTASEFDHDHVRSCPLCKKQFKG